jgi:O-antigen/teichoic acid export membrane protein
MSTSVKTLAKNAGAMMASQLVTWGLSLALAVFLPRYLGPEIIGEISIGNSIWLIMTILISFGMDLHLTKAVARDPQRAGELLGTSLSVRLIFSVVASLIVLGYVQMLDLGARATAIIALLGVGYIIAAVSGAYGSVLIGLERMGSLAVANIVGKSALTGGCILLMYLGASVYPIVAMNILTSLLPMVMMFTFTPAEYRLRLNFNLRGMWDLVNVSKQYLVTALVITAYQQIDKLFIVTLVDTKTVGWYGAAMNLFGTLMFIPGIFGVVVLPTLSRGYATGDEWTNVVARRGLDLMFLLSVPIGLGTFMIAQPLVVLLYGAEFRPSGEVLAVLGIVLIFTYLNTFLGQLLISSDRTGRWNVVMLCSMLLTIPLDFILVPWTRDVLGNGALGGATAFLFTEAVMVSGAILLLPKGTLQWSNVRTAVMTLVCGATMVASSWWLRDELLLVSIVVAAVVYCGTVVLFRVVSREDLQIMMDVSRQLVTRLRRGKNVQVGVGD